MHASAISRVTFGAAFLVAPGAQPRTSVEPSSDAPLRFVIGLLTPAGQATFHHWAEGEPDSEAWNCSYLTSSCEVAATASTLTVSTGKVEQKTMYDYEGR